jgi:hypothetical protein
VFVHNQPIHAYEINLQRIRWRHWGARSATAKAVSVYCFMRGTQRTPVRVRAFRRLTRCGHRAYTRLHVRFPDGVTERLRPAACRTRLG